MAKSTPRRPDREFWVHPALVEVWHEPIAMDGARFREYTIRVQKRYKDQRTGTWKTTSFFRPDELPRLILAAQKAYEHVMLRVVGASEARSTTTVAEGQGGNQAQSASGGAHSDGTRTCAP